MTLDTKLRIFEKVDPEQVWPLATSLARPPDWSGPDPTPDIKRNGQWIETWNPAGIGFNAWVIMYVNTGPEPGWRHPPTSDEWEKWHNNPEYPDDTQSWDDYVAGHGPPCWVELSWDTAYSYRDKLGGCGDLHRRITAAVGEWLDGQGIDWSAMNEYTGKWEKCPMPNDEPGRSRAA